MSALAQWHAELAARRRTTIRWDALFFAAQQEVADAEFERQVMAPQRAYVAALKLRKKRKRAPRPAKWERDAAASMTVGANDGA